ncbi:survival of motor neuron-related-splicing factor 30-like [Bolinopsis microptera]|uniref:survival of motor neuron-related-splicing factor 30-like n=1 Tax=Bolinopsis microptera TaxID=2820187 RepID=UPI0030795125
MDSLGDIHTYRVQLEQVDAALVGEPENEELIKLKADLLDIIALTEDLMGLSSSKKSKVMKEVEEDTFAIPVQKKKTVMSLYDDDDDVEVMPSTAVTSTDQERATVTETSETEAKVTISNFVVGRRAEAPKVDIIDEKERLYRQQLQELKMLTCDWKPGDKCQALNSDTNQYNEAEVLANGDGYLQIKYNDDGVVANVLLSNVRKHKKRRWGEVTNAPTPEEAKKSVIEKEKKKKKKLSRKQRQTEMENAKEQEKKSWLSFMKGNKTVAKNSTKKSIFASPDNFDGKIGIGTCGISGKGMTSFTGPDKWKR